MSASAYPLSWPVGWKRVPVGQRQRARFSQGHYSGTYTTSKPVTVATARGRLQGELDRLGARNVVLSTDMELRLDGQPRSDRSEPSDSGAAVYFDYRGKPTVLACDRWDRVADNITALAKHIEAMRGMDRWGVGSLEQAFTGYQALPAPDPWWRRLKLDAPTRSERDIKDAYRRAAADAHPDRPGGSHDKMADLNAARDEGLKLIGTQA